MQTLSAQGFYPNATTLISSPSTALTTPCDISCTLFLGAISLFWPVSGTGVQVETTVSTAYETVYINNGTSVTSTETPYYSSGYTADDGYSYIPSLYVNGTVTGNGVQLVYPTQYVVVGAFQPVTDCSIPGCTAASDCNVNEVYLNVPETALPFRGFTASYYYLDDGVDSNNLWDEEIQEFLSLISFPSDCAISANGPPYYLSPESQVIITQTVTSSYIGQSATPKAYPSTTISPTAPYALTPIPPSSASTQAPISTDTIVSTVSRSIAAPLPTTPSAIPVITIANSAFTADSVSQYQVDTQVPTPGGSAITVPGTKISLSPAVSNIVVGGKTEALSQNTSPALEFPTYTIGGSAIAPNPSITGIYTLGTQTLVPGGAPITVLGTTVSLAPSASVLVINGVTSMLPAAPTTQIIQPPLVIGSSSITTNSAGIYVIGTEALVPGGAPITVSGTTISLAPSASALVINGVTSVLPAAPTAQITQAPLIIGSSTITANSAGHYVIGTQTLVPGGAAVTVSGTTISLAPSASALVINGVTSVLPAAPTAQITQAPLIIGSSTITANSAGLYILGTQTLVPGGPAITVNGNSISLAPSDSAIVVNGHTYPAIQTTSPPASPIATIGGETLSLNSAGSYQIGTQVLSPGGPAITISGTPVSLATSGGALVVGGSTEALAPAPATASTGGLGGIIFSGFGGMPSATGSVSVFTGGAAGGAAWEWGAYYFVGMISAVGAIIGLY